MSPFIYIVRFISNYFSPYFMIIIILYQCLFWQLFMHWGLTKFHCALNFFSRVISTPVEISEARRLQAR